MEDRPSLLGSNWEFVSLALGLQFFQVVTGINSDTTVILLNDVHTKTPWYTRSMYDLARLNFALNEIMNVFIVTSVPVSKTRLKCL